MLTRALKYAGAVAAAMLLSACAATDVANQNQFIPNRDLQLPEEGKILFFAGQDLGAVGGLDNYTEGYVDFFGIPAGITSYTSVKHLEALDTLNNGGAGDQFAGAYLNDPDFANASIAIGLYMVDQLDEINSGKLDGNIKQLGEWIKKTNRPVFLRIGYEFEGEWNHYPPKPYIKAYRRIVTQLQEQGVNNFVSVWQSTGYEEQRDNLLRWYPGDEYVDWMAYSYFNHKPDEAGIEIRRLAREKEKPVMMAEVTPRGMDILLDDGETIWNKWFVPFIAHVDKNSDVIKAVAYINQRWDDQPMWKGQGWGDSRIQAEAFVRQQWSKEIVRPRWVHGPLLGKDKLIDLPADYFAMIEARKTKLASAKADGALQAEDAKPTGNTRYYPDTSASNGGGMAYIYQEGDSFMFEDVPQASEVIVRYASERSGTLGLYVNGTRMSEIAFKATGAWVGSYELVTVKANIPQGAELKVQFDTGDAAANIDYLQLK